MIYRLKKAQNVSCVLSMGGSQNAPVPHHNNIIVCCEEERRWDIQSRIFFFLHSSPLSILQLYSLFRGGDIEANIIKCTFKRQFCF